MSFNTFGIACYYCHRLSYDPNAFLMLDQLSNMACEHPAVGSSGVALDIPSVPPAPPWPWKSMGIWELMTWMMTGSSQKSEAEVTCLVHEVIQAKDFDHVHFDGFSAHTQMSHFDKFESATSADLQQDGWKESSVDILVPTWEHSPDGNGQPFTIPGLFHHSLTGVIHAVFTEKAAKWFHLTLFKRIWKSPATGQEQHLYDKLYTSDAWINTHNDLQKQQRDDGCTLEHVIAGLMFWSDATHLAQFGNTSAWPMYLFFGNQSKYIWGHPNSGACHPITFVPTVSLSHLVESVQTSHTCLKLVTRNHGSIHIQDCKEKGLEWYFDSLKTRAISQHVECIAG